MVLQGLRDSQERASLCWLLKQIVYTRRYWNVLETLVKTVKEALSVLMLCAPSNRRWPFSYHTCFVRFLVQKLAQTQKSALNMARSDSQIDKPQHGRPKRAELPDVNINTGAQSINTERACLKLQHFQKFIARALQLFKWLTHSQ